MSSELISVTGSDCLEYIDRAIGFGSHDYIVYGNMSTLDLLTHNFIGAKGVNTGDISAEIQYTPAGFETANITTTLFKWSHDPNKRVIGLITDESPDGGLQVAILGNETIANSIYGGNTLFYGTYLNVHGRFQFNRKTSPPNDWYLVTEKVGGYPQYGEIYGFGESCHAVVNNGVTLGFDDAMDYNPTNDGFLTSQPFGVIWKYAGADTTTGGEYTLTNDKNNTMVFGVIQDLYDFYDYPNICTENPLAVLGGNLYAAMGRINYDLESVIPTEYPFDINMDMVKIPYPDTIRIDKTNLTAIPFNLILTRSEQAAKNYLSNGTLPSDAFLYPLDFENLPRYDEDIPTGDEPEDFDDDNEPGNNDRDFDTNLPESPSYTVNQLTNYNWYWLTVADWAAFIRWFWNDIGAYNDFDDIIAKVKGLYNDVASAVIMCRYYPVNVAHIGGVGAQEPIKLGMIEKGTGVYDTINQSSPLRAVDIGHHHVSKKYKSFMDMTPYSQLSLYLPWHGFIDLDNDLFVGHDVYVKALYDYLSGTIQYYIYYDNKLLVNTVIAKIAMDIPITLQTKNDRDSAIFSNVSSTISGLVGAGAGIASGNPIGIALGVTQGVGALNNANASAPMRFMGNVGETGGYVAPQHCYLIIRRPTIQPSDAVTDKNSGNIKKALKTWKKNVGMVCGYGYTLSDLKGDGFTMCHSPRITFSNTAPLQSEVDEIYDYLSKGVIL